MRYQLNPGGFTQGFTCLCLRCIGERRRKGVRGCIVSPDLSVLNLVIVKKGDKVCGGWHTVL